MVTENGMVLDLDGSSEQVTITDTKFMDGWEELSISLWVTVDTISTNSEGIITTRDSLSFMIWNLQTNGRSDFFVGDGGGFTQSISSVGWVPTGTLLQLGLSWRKNEAPTFWKNGTFVVGNQVVNRTISQNDNLYIGWDNSAAARRLDGRIRDVRIWERVLRDNEWIKLYKDTLGGGWGDLAWKRSRFPSALAEEVSSSSSPSSSSSSLSSSSRLSSASSISSSLSSSSFSSSSSLSSSSSISSSSQSTDFPDSKSITVVGPSSITLTSSGPATSTTTRSGPSSKTLTKVV
jgi:hypothetical protein